MKGWQGTGRLMTSVTFYLCANSVTVNYTVRVVLMAKAVPHLGRVLIVLLAVPLHPLPVVVVPTPDSFFEAETVARAFFRIPKNFFWIF